MGGASGNSGVAQFGRVAAEEAAGTSTLVSASYVTQYGRLVHHSEHLGVISAVATADVIQFYAASVVDALGLDVVVVHANAVVRASRARRAGVHAGPLELRVDGLRSAHLRLHQVQGCVCHPAIRRPTLTEVVAPVLRARVALFLARHVRA